MRVALLLALLLAAGALAGCTKGGGSGGDGATSSTGQSPASFDGQAALSFVRQVALRDDGSPRYRIPGTAGQREGAGVLWNATDLAGWDRQWQNFTGRDYLALDREAVHSYTEPDPAYDPPGGGNPRGCSPSDHDQVPSLPFSNLLAVRWSASANAPLLLLGAHWDSQMHSDYDPDPAKRDLPDPGANDGASGVGVLLQLMRDATGRSLPFSLGLLFIDGEDGFYDCYPDAGSLYYAQHPLEQPSAFILLDMVGDAGAIYPKESYSHQSAPALQDLLWAHGQSRPGGPAHFVNRTTPIEDDHLAFIQAGIPSVDFIDAGRPGTFPPQWDTTGDTVDKVSADMLGRVGQVLLDSLQDPAFAAAFD